MKKFFFIIGIFWQLGLMAGVVFSWTAGAGAKPEGYKVLEVTDGKAVIEVPTSLTVGESLYKSAKTNNLKRNGFVDLQFSVHMDVDLWDPVFNMAVGYGEVVRDVWGWGGEPLHFDGYVELGGNGSFLYTTGLFSIAAAFYSEFNFIQNNGINNFIPGVIIQIEGTTVVAEEKTKTTYLSRSAFRGGAFYKIFVSKRFALIPKATVAYDIINSTFSVAGGLSLRRYF